MVEKYYSVVLPFKKFVTPDYSLVQKYSAIYPFMSFRVHYSRSDAQKRIGPYLLKDNYTTVIKNYGDYFPNLGVIIEDVMDEYGLRFEITFKGNYHFKCKLKEFQEIHQRKYVYTPIKENNLDLSPIQEYYTAWIEILKVFENDVIHIRSKSCNIFLVRMYSENKDPILSKLGSILRERSVCYDILGVKKTVK